MDNNPVFNLVATQCDPDVEERFNKWYNEVHVPMLFKFKGIKRVTRLKIADASPDHPKYLAIYEFENQKAFEAYQTSPELTAAREEMQQTWQGKGWKSLWRVPYQTIKIWTR